MPQHRDRGPPAPRVVVRPSVVESNASAVADRFDGRVVGVTKATCGDPVVAGAMLAGGLDGIGDSRLRNLARVAAEHDAETTLLRGPTPREAARAVTVADRALHSEVAAVDALGAAAAERGETHEVVLMVDVGDRREGVMPADAPAVAARADDCDGVEVVGLGTNVGCFGGVVPTADQLASFVEVVERAEDAVGRRFDVVSGGSTVTLPLVESGDLPERVTELRVGEGVLLGTDVTTGRRIPYLRGDAFEVRAAVVECRTKPSTPEGVRGRNVDGERPEFESRGDRERALVALGEQDVVVDELRPLADGVDVLGASSDHAVLDVTDADADVSVGTELRFRVGYRALVRAFTSEYVTVEYATGEGLE